MLQPDQFLRAIADLTRLRIVVLLFDGKELCVCELTQALAILQPKVSRHLAILRKAGIVLDRREGLWIHYRIHPDLPTWAARTLAAIHEGCQKKRPYADDRSRLNAMPPQSRATCKV